MKKQYKLYVDGVMFYDPFYAERKCEYDVITNRQVKRWAEYYGRSCTITDMQGKVLCRYIIDKTNPDGGCYIR